jgi:hypothetical protein
VEQNATTSELARNAAVSSQFVVTVADGASEIERDAADASSHSGAVDRASRPRSNSPPDLKTRFVIFLRQTEIGDRCRHDRLPCDMAVTLLHRDRPSAGGWSTFRRAACLCGGRAHDTHRRHGPGRDDCRPRQRARAPGQPLGARPAFQIHQPRSRDTVSAGRQLAAVRAENAEAIRCATEVAGRMAAEFRLP